MVTPAARREAVAHLCAEHEVSQRRACDVLDVDRSSVRYNSVRPDDTDLRKAIRDVAQQRRRFGYRRIGIMLEREGIVMNHKKLRRLYKEEGLAAICTARIQSEGCGLPEPWLFDMRSASGR